MRYPPPGWLLLAVLASACTRPMVPRPPEPLGMVAVLPPNNQTGDGLLISGASFLETYAGRSERFTVGDALAVEARAQLDRHGIAVVPADTVEAATAGRVPGSPAAAAELARSGKLEGSVLYLEIDRWEPDAGTHPAYVIVALRAALVEVATGNLRWTAHRSASPVATPGAVTLGSAYAIAAQKVAEELLASWGPESPAR